jgi:hypothetical protein
MKTIRIWFAICWLCLLSPAVFAQYTLTFTTNGNVITLTGYTGTPVSVTVPNFVTSIGDEAFWFCSTLRSVTIPESVTNIGVTAFGTCPLTSIVIPESVTTIGDGAFEYTDLGSVTIPDSVTNLAGAVFFGCGFLSSVTLPGNLTSIGGSEFNGCYSLQGITIPNGVTSIEPYAFNDTGLFSITIPSGVTSIGSAAFQNCGSLTNIYFQGNAPAADPSIFTVPHNNPDPVTVLYAPCTSGWSSTFEGVPTAPWWQAEFSWTTQAGSITLTAYSGICNSLNIPSAINGVPVTAIGADAFYGMSNLANVTIPVGVTSIGASAFWGCTGLASITIPYSVTGIGEYAFEACTDLTDIYFDGNAPNGDATVFNQDTNATVYFEPCATGWNSTFGGVPALPESLLGFTYVTNGSGITIASYSGTCDVVAIPSTINNLPVTSIGTNAFYEATNLTSVTIPNSVTNIGNYAFDGDASLTSVAIGTNIFSIGEYAFAGCTGLSSITLPDSITNIGFDAFVSCAIYPRISKST